MDLVDWSQMVTGKGQVSMKGTTKQTIGIVVMSTGVLTVFNSFELHTVGPFWLGGTVTIIGVLLAVLGWKLLSRGRSDGAVADEQRNDAEVARHRAHLAGEDPHDQHLGDESARSPEAESSLEDPPDSR